MYVRIDCTNDGNRVGSSERGGGAKRGLHTQYHECGGKALAGGVSDSQAQTIMGEWQEIVTVTTHGPNLAAARAIAQRVTRRIRVLHEALLHITGQSPVFADIHYRCVRCHLRTSVTMSIREAQNRQDDGSIFFSKIFPGMSRTASRLRLLSDRPQNGACPCGKSGNYPDVSRAGAALCGLACEDAKFAPERKENT